MATFQLSSVSAGDSIDPRLEFFRFKRGKTIAQVDTVGITLAGDFDASTYEIHLTGTVDGKPVAEKIDAKELLQSWLAAIKEDT